MAESPEKTPGAPADGAPSPTATPADGVGHAAYEVIRRRLHAHAGDLRTRLDRLDARRREVFGGIDHRILRAERITTAHNCVPQDMVQLDHGRFLFGFNLQLGLKRGAEPSDVFAVYRRDDDGTLREEDLSLLADSRFLADFRRLYHVYERTTFRKFSLIDGHLYMVFHIGPGPADVSVLKWLAPGDGLRYVDGRAEAEYRRVGLPPAHQFAWRTPDRQSFRYGDHPHVSIEDRVFVECVGGDLTIKVEDNTETGEGIHSEPVDDRHQKVDDAEIAYAVVGMLVLLRIRPYKETVPRHFIFNSRLGSVVRVDPVGDSCALLPADHGLVFPDGCYLATGELKRFDTDSRGFVLERILHAPNGEDSLYVFYHRETGEYVLMPYRVTTRRVEERIACHGFSLFPNGHLLLFRADNGPQKHHQLQLRQTPFHHPGFEPPGQEDAYLHRVGNRQVVRGLADLREVLALAGREPPYPELYADLHRRCQNLLDAHPWLASDDGFGIDGVLRAMRETAGQAVDEFDRVRRRREEAGARVRELTGKVNARLQEIRRTPFRTVDDFTVQLAALRHLRGELASAREDPHADPAPLDAATAEVAGQSETLAGNCVRFLLDPSALAPHRQRAETHLASVPTVERTVDARRIEEALTEEAAGLDLLTEIVNGLPIEDPAETTRILDAITAVYSLLNQARAALKRRLRDLVTSEGAARFAAQIKLLGQTAAGYLDQCDTPARCDEFLNRITVQLEELEGAFAGFDEYLLQVDARRTELHAAFEQRRLALEEEHNRLAASLESSADRILKVVAHRLSTFESPEDLHAYMASDSMVGRVRDLVARLLAMGDPVRADGIEGRLKSVQQDAVRQLRDRRELSAEGPGMVRLGRHTFHVNAQALDLTIVLREGEPHLHLTGTRYFSPVTDPAYLATRAAWDCEVPSEDASVYRGEYLADRMADAIEAEGGREAVDGFLAASEEDRLARVQAFMAGRYAEGYTRGIHDVDAVRILGAVLHAASALGPVAHHPTARAASVLWWHRFCPGGDRKRWSATLRAMGERDRAFPGDTIPPHHAARLQEAIAKFADETRLFDPDTLVGAGNYLVSELCTGVDFGISHEADRSATEFIDRLAARGAGEALADARRALSADPAREFELVRDWIRGHLGRQCRDRRWLDETAVRVFLGADWTPRATGVAGEVDITGCRGAHPRIVDGTCRVDLLDFRSRLARFHAEATPRFAEWRARKQALLESERERLRLEEFRPRVLTSFVRNQLIDEVYLPLVGDNLAKQVGAAGDRKRTDLMGLLLLISPPGYGKTTLLEYLASRLGLVFVKVNGPALGHGVRSLDPAEAPNAAARSEINRLNLALEMGDNVLLCVDDIQHCHPEFLQKFISLCDAQRKIEGVWNGQTRTYDLRGRKFAVVMAGNPFTESGGRFQLPDMLANRADTYNLGDIIGGSADRFAASYLENAVTSNPVLAPLAGRSPADVRAFIRIASTGDRETVPLEGAYSEGEVDEILAVLQRLATLRDALLRVNREYIRSAGQSDDFRTEPPFRLQGSYRNMNRLAEKVVPALNDAELQALLLDHYESEAQTLAAGAEANRLKLRRILGLNTPEEDARWEEICRTFRRLQTLRGAESADAAGRVVAQLATVQDGLEAIRSTLAARPASAPAVPPPDLSPIERSLAAVAEALRAPRHEPANAGPTPDAGVPTDRIRSLLHELEMIHSTLATLKDVASQHRDHLRSARELLATRARQGTVEIEVTQEMLANEAALLERFQEVLSGGAGEGRQRPPDPPGPRAPDNPTDIP